MTLLPDRPIRRAATPFARAALALVLVPLAAGLAAGPAGAAGMRVIASDDRGVTLRVEIPAPALKPGPTAGRTRLGLPDLEVADEPGRPLLPYASALVALPPGARAVVTLLPVDGEDVTDGVRLEVARRPDFRLDPVDGSAVPIRETVPPIADGRWPAAPVAASEPYPWRGNRLVRVIAHPFTYDEAAARLWTRRRFDVRVEFVGGTPVSGAGAGLPGAPDVAARSVLERALANPAQAERFRQAPRPARRASALDAASLLRRAPGTAAATAAAAFDEGFPEVRVRVDTTGVWALDYPTLAANGYPALVPITNVSVHRHEFVEGVTPPYVTIELPIEVDDRNFNGLFDTPDRIIVSVQNWAQRSGASMAQRAWGDGEVLFVTRTAGAALRMPTRPSWRGAAGLTPLASYPWTQRWERTFSFFLVPDDTTSDRYHWTEEVVYYNRPDSILFETNHLDPTRDATVSLNWAGRTVNRHIAFAEIRNGPAAPFTAVADSTNADWNGKATFTRTTTVPGAVLGEGNVNRLRMWGKIFGAPDPLVNARMRGSFNWLEVTYWRQFRTLNASGTLPRASFLACNSGDAAGEYQVRVTGLTGGASRDVKIYDVTDPQNPVRLTIAAADTLAQIQSAGGGEFRVDFQDSTAAGQPRRYAVFSTPKFLPAARYSAVTRRQLTERAAGDYLLIASEAFLPAAQALANHRAAQGVNVVVAPAEAVFDEFNGGRKSSHAIKRFVRHAYDNWGTMFALLLGDASQDPRGLLATSSRDWVPSQEISGPVGITLGLEIVPADPWYGCVTNNCNLGDAIADVPDVAVGRIPSQTLQQAQDAVAKIVAYEQFAPGQAWRNRMLLSADDAYSGESFFGGGGGASQYCFKFDEFVFEEISDTIAAVIRDGAGLALTDVDRFDLSSYLTGETEDGSRCRPDLNATRDRTHAAVTPQLLSRLNAGVMWWNYQGHANEFVLAHENLYLNSAGIDDKDNLTNDGMPFLFSAFSCHANAFARPGDDEGGRGPSLGEEMVMLPSRGAIASWASSGYEILPDQGGQHINTSLARRMFANPPHNRFLGSTGSRVLLGEGIALALLDYVSPFRFFERGIGLTYHLLGDPLQQMSIGPVQAVVKANEQPVSSGVAIRLATPGDTLRLDADLVSSVQITSLVLERHLGTTVDTIPAANYTVTPAFPDTGLAGLGGRRFRLVHRSILTPYSFRYVIRTTDRYGVPSAFEAVFDFFAQLRVSGTPIANGDAVAPEAALSLLVLSPSPLDPQADLTLTINGVAQAFTAAPANGDASGREWILSWDHGPYPIDDYNVRLQAAGGDSRDLLFRVTIGGGELRLVNVLNFPNPFEENLGTHFSFSIQSGAPTDVMIRIYTPSGRLIYERVERGLNPGYHQIAWDGRDAEGSHLANGVYVGRVLATNGSSKAESTMRLIKLRRPRGADDTAATP